MFHSCCTGYADQWFDYGIETSCFKMKAPKDKHNVTSALDSTSTKERERGVRLMGGIFIGC